MKKWIKPTVYMMGVESTKEDITADPSIDTGLEVHQPTAVFCNECNKETVDLVNFLNPENHNEGCSNFIGIGTENLTMS